MRSVRQALHFTTEMRRACIQGAWKLTHRARPYRFQCLPLLHAGLSDTRASAQPPGGEIRPMPRYDFGDTASVGIGHCGAVGPRRSDKIACSTQKGISPITCRTPSCSHRWATYCSRLRNGPFTQRFTAKWLPDLAMMGAFCVTAAFMFRRNLYIWGEASGVVRSSSRKAPFT